MELLRGRRESLGTRLVVHRLNFLLNLSAPLAFSVIAEYQPEEIGEKGARRSRTRITPLQKATSGNQEAEKRFLALRKA